MPILAVLDSFLAYQDVGEGRAFVFLHGNPASSHVWRNVLPGIGKARKLAPDLIGMGDSGKPDIAYSFADHARYLDAFLDALELARVVLVGHDWGGALAFDWAARHPERVSGIIFFETIVRPLRWNDLPPSAKPRYEALLTPGLGERKVLDENFFIEHALQATALSGIDDAAMEAYRRPYPTPASRRPLLAWARSTPIEGAPAEVVARIEAYDAWLAASVEVPKLLVTFDGPVDKLMIGPAMADWCAGNIAALEIENGGVAAHVAQEDRPGAIAAAISAFADRHALR